MKLVYTEEAIADLKRLREFITLHNPIASAKVAKELVEKITLLPDFPHIGLPVKQAPLPDSVRDMIFGSYIVRYSIHRNTVIILRVWHGLENER